MAVDPNKFLGKGWKFPIQVDARTGGIATSEGVDSVRESIEIIIGTAVGTRIMNRKFGSTAQASVFEPANTDSVGRLVSDVERAITQQEPRVAAVQVSATIDFSRVDLFIRYRITSVNIIDNFVYPFYLEERSP